MRVVELPNDEPPVVPPVEQPVARRSVTPSNSAARRLRSASSIESSVDSAITERACMAMRPEMPFVGTLAGMGNIFSPPRDPTPEERVVLDFVIDANPDSRDALRALLANTKVTSVCGCGCGSPDLTTDDAAVDPSLRTWDSPLPGEAAAKVGGEVCTAMLFVTPEGALLDVTWFCDDDKRPNRLPRLEELEIAQWEELPVSRRSRRHGTVGHRRLANFPPSDEELEATIEHLNRLLRDKPTREKRALLRRNLAATEEELRQRRAADK